jgi:4-hydroxy-tetrahydrodipicolinate synthase
MAEAVGDLAGRLAGRLIPAVPVPFSVDGRLDRTAQQAYARWMAHEDVGAVALWVHTGRGLWLSDDQRIEVLQTWREAAPHLPLVCGVGVPRAAAETTVNETVRLARAAQAGGAAAVMVHPPGLLRGDPALGQRVLELHRAVADVGLPTIAFYLYEDAGGVAYGRELVQELLEIPGVIGIKIATLDSVMTYQDLASVVPASSLLITGEDRFLGYSLMAGARAALIGMGAACTDVMAALLRAWFDQRLAEFVRLSAAVDRFAAVTFTAPMEGYVQRMLWALEADGVLPGEFRDPFGPVLTRQDRERVRRAVADLRAR